MFDSLSGALGKAWRALAGEKILTEKNIEEGIRAVRQALLEADVNFKVAKDFIKDVKGRALGQEVIGAVNPGDQFVLECHWDNSAANQPVLEGQRIEPRDLNWGEGTHDEMCLTGFYLTQ